MYQEMSRPKAYVIGTLITIIFCILCGFIESAQGAGILNNTQVTGQQAEKIIIDFTKSYTVVGELRNFNGGIEVIDHWDDNKIINVQEGSADYIKVMTICNDSVFPAGYCAISFSPAKQGKDAGIVVTGVNYLHELSDEGD